MFSIATLQENNNNLNDINSISKINPESYIESLLTTNDEIHDINTDIQIDYYKNLYESSINLNEGLKDIDLRELKIKVLNIISSIISFLRKIGKLLYDIDRETTKIYLSNKKESNNFSFEYNDRTFEKYWNMYTSGSSDNSLRFNNEKKEEYKDRAYKRFQEIDKYKFNISIYHYPLPKDMDPNRPKSAINSFITWITEICEGNGNNVAPNISSLESAFGDLTRAIKPVVRGTSVSRVIDKKSYKEYVKENITVVDKDRISVEEWKKYVDDIPSSLGNEFDKKFIDPMTKELENMKRKISSSKSTLTNEEVGIVNTYLGYIKQIVDSWTWCIQYIQSTHNKNLNSIVTTYKRIIKNVYIGSDSNFSEAGAIHGEPFNGDTLFDNEDLDDFNRTEWLDLSLTTECYALKYDIVESQRRIALQEALILSDDEPNKIKRLISMKEAEGNNLKNKVITFIENIKNIINKFLAVIKDTYGKNANFLSKYQKEIAKPVNPEAKITSKGDIIAGMYRVQDNLNFVTYDYNTLRDDLNDKNNFFQKHILSNLNKNSQYSKRSVKFDGNMSIIDFCKAYYGASISDDKQKPCEFNGKEIETNKANIVKFLQNSNTFISSIKSDINKLEEQSRKVNQTVNQQSDTNNQQSNNQENQNKQESYYSVLYNKFITEADIDMGTSENNSDGNNNQNNSEASGFKVYLDAYKDVLLSKITAIEFIVSELMQVLRAHTGIKENKVNDQNNNQQTNNQQKPNNESAVLNENFFINKDDIYYEFERWNKKDRHILFITGLSGSGKSTLANQLCKKYGAIKFELDWIDFADVLAKKSVEELGKNSIPNLIKTFYDQSSLAKNSIKVYDLNFKSYRNFFMTCYDYVYKNLESKTNKNTLFIIEGVQVPVIYDDNLFSGDIIYNPLIIKGTSTITSLNRRYKRRGSGASSISEWLSDIRWYSSLDKDLKRVKNEVEYYKKAIQLSN